MLIFYQSFLFSQTGHVHVLFRFNGLLAKFPYSPELLHQGSSFEFSREIICQINSAIKLLTYGWIIQI